MQNIPTFKLSLLNDLLGKDIVKEFDLDVFPEDKKKQINDKLEERVQKVILKTAVDKMTDEQFEAFQKAVKNENNPALIQETVSELAQHIPDLQSALKVALEKEITVMKKIVKKG